MFNDKCASLQNIAGLEGKKSSGVLSVLIFIALEIKYKGNTSCHRSVSKVYWKLPVGSSLFIVSLVPSTCQQLVILNNIAEINTKNKSKSGAGAGDVN